MYRYFCFSSRIRHTICALVTGVQTCALPISLLPIAELDTVRRPSISTRVRLSPRLRSWIDDRHEFWVLPVTVESLSVDESCGRSASVSLSSLFPDSSRSSLVMLPVGAAVSYVSRAMRSERGGGGEGRVS